MWSLLAGATVCDKLPGVKAISFSDGNGEVAKTYKITRPNATRLKFNKPMRRRESQKKREGMKDASLKVCTHTES